jgi:hypothetical protein
MRYLRIIAAGIFVFSILFAGWANHQYNRNLNTDYPKITSNVEKLEISVNDPDEAIYRELYAEDATDGELTSQIMVASVSHFIEPGTVRVKYVVFDSHNNSATLSRPVHYTDYKAPSFSLEKSPVYTIGSSFDLMDYISVEDCIDGDVSDRIRVISNMVNNYSVGNYPVVLEVSNSCGDTEQITLWVSYESKESTAVVKLHKYIVYVEQGQNFDPSRWIASVTDRNAVALNMEKIEIQGNLDTNKTGCYQLVYNYDDGKLSGYAPLTVVVTERQG